ncbi:MAG TPA: T9SS type A sorting domain-containing protein, partial [bacterium (Candidatus Stahlbacteria)]|nr:T9SS type A sorting domain-containing protein [Candidatus Stahlbacteria bacterium]
MKLLILLLCVGVGLLAVPPTARDGSVSTARPVSEKVVKRYPTFQGEVLFVEDPGNPGFGPATKPDPNWDQMLTELYGAGNYDWFGPTTDPNENGPDAATMSQYPLVIWNCYDYWWGAPQGYPPSLTTTDQGEIGTYIDGGGAFFLIGQDLIWSGVPQSWLNQYFYLQSVVEDYAWNEPTLTEQGENELAGLTCTFTSDYQNNGFFCDNLTAASGANTVLEDQTYPGNHPALLGYGGSYRTSFWTIDGRSPDNWDTWKEMVRRIIGCLAVSERPSAQLRHRLTITPNPAQDLVRLTYQIPNKSHLSISIYDLSGRRVRTVANKITRTG